MAVFWWHYVKSDVHMENTISVWLGTCAFAFNMGIRVFSSENISLIKWTRPFCEVVCIAGTLMTVMIMARIPDAFHWSVNLFSVVGHLLVGISSYGVDFTLEGVIACISILLCALLVYWMLDSTATRAWPYPLSPIEVLSFCLPFLVLRLL